MILRRFEGGWPWLLTKRICLGGGMVGLIAEAIAEAHSWQAHGGLLACQGEEGAGSWELALGRRATPTRRSPWTVEAAMRGAPGAVSLSLDFFLGGTWRRKQQSVRFWRRGGGRGAFSRLVRPSMGAWRGLGRVLEFGYRGGGSISGADRSRGTRWACFRRSTAGAQHQGHNANDGRRTLMEVMMIFVGSSGGGGLESWGGVGSRGHPPPRTRHRLPWWNRRVVVAQEGRRAGSGGVGRARAGGD